MFKKTIVLTTLFFFLIIAFGIFRKQTLSPAHEEALDALRMIANSRAYPYYDIPDDGFGKAYDFYKKNFVGGTKKYRNSWENIGPRGQGGRTISFAIDPNDTAKLWIGAASGGLWKSTTGGFGTNAWTYVPTGLPVCGVGAIAVNPTNSNDLFIGTGETYDYGSAVNGLIVRTTRGSNGIGILHSSDGGLTWNYSLNWLYNQRRGVWRILFNPLNPNTIYAATTEGVYKTIDHGNNWNQVLNKTMVMDLDMDPSDTTILYAGVGNLGSANKGIYKTTNAGSSWNILTNGLPPNTHDGRIIIDIFKSNPNILMAHICNKFYSEGVYKSNDKGNSWTAVNTSFDICSYQGWYADGLLIHPSNSQVVLAAGVDFFLSNDGGASFLQNTNMPPYPDIHGIFSNPLNSQMIYVLSDVGLYRSNDFGNTFQECLGGYTTAQAYKGSVSTTDSNVILVGLQDHNTFLYSGGFPENWTPVLGGDGSFNAIDPTDDQIQYASYQYLNVYQSQDQGLSFFTQIYSNNASPSGPNNCAFIAPFALCKSNTNTLYAGDSALIKSTDQGMSWFYPNGNSIDNGNKIISIAVSSHSTDTVYASTAPEFGPMHIFRSTNGGNSMTDVSSTLPNRYPRDIEVNPENASQVYVAFSGFGTGHLYRSSNAGNTWVDISTSLPDIPFHCVLVDPLDTKHVFAGSDLGIFASSDSGQTWTAMNTGLPDATMIFDLIYSPSDRSVLAFSHGHGVFRFKLDPVIHLGSSHVQRNHILVYPNPFHDEMTIQCEGTHLQYVIMNAFGQRVGQGVLNGSNYRIHTENLSPGFYTLFVQQDKSVIYKEKILKED